MVMAPSGSDGYALPCTWRRRIEADGAVGAEVERFLTWLSTDEFSPLPLPHGEARTVCAAREGVARRPDGSTVPVELTISEAWIGERRLFTGPSDVILDDLLRERRSVALTKHPSTAPVSVLTQGRCETNRQRHVAHAAAEALHRGEQPLGLAAVEIPRQTLLQLWHPGRSRDVVGNSVMFLQKPVEAPHRR
jgi:hypothetical protein